MFNNIFVFENRAVYEVMRQNSVHPDRWQYGACALRAGHPSLHTRMLRICNTYAFPLQQWLHERASVLRYMYNACLVASDLRISLRARDILTSW